MLSQLIGSAFPIKTPAIRAIEMQVRAAINFMGQGCVNRHFLTGASGIGVEKAPLWVR